MAVEAGAAADRKPRQRLRFVLLTAAWAALLLAMARTLPQLRAARPGRCQSKALLPLKHRELFGQLLEQEGFTVGAELGVQRGWFANLTLSTWPSCRKYYLVDAWAHQVGAGRRGRVCVAEPHRPTAASASSAPALARAPLLPLFRRIMWRAPTCPTTSSR